MSQDPPPEAKAPSGLMAATPNTRSWDPVQLALTLIVGFACVLAVVYANTDDCIHPRRERVLLTAFVLWCAASIGLFVRVLHHGPRSQQMLTVVTVVVGAFFLLVGVVDHEFDSMGRVDRLDEELSGDGMWTISSIRGLTPVFGVDQRAADCAIADIAVQGSYWVRGNRSVPGAMAGRHRQHRMGDRPG